MKDHATRHGRLRDLEGCLWFENLWLDQRLAYFVLTDANFMPWLCILIYGLL